MDDQRLSQLEKSIEEIKESQTKIADALLGNFSNNKMGLIEESRNLRKEVDGIQTVLAEKGVQLKELMDFKKNIKLIMTVLGLVIPFLMELVKIIFGNIYDFFKH